MLPCGDCSKKVLPPSGERLINAPFRHRLVAANFFGRGLFAFDKEKRYARKIEGPAQPGRYTFCGIAGLQPSCRAGTSFVMKQRKQNSPAYRFAAAKSAMLRSAVRGPSVRSLASAPPKKVTRAPAARLPVPFRVTSALPTPPLR